jgi:nucleolar protein 6
MSNRQLKKEAAPERMQVNGAERKKTKPQPHEAAKALVKQNADKSVIDAIFATVVDDPESHNEATKKSLARERKRKRAPEQDSNTSAEVASQLKSANDELVASVGISAATLHERKKKKRKSKDEHQITSQPLPEAAAESSSKSNDKGEKKRKKKKVIPTEADEVDPLVESTQVTAEHTEQVSAPERSEERKKAKMKKQKNDQTSANEQPASESITEPTTKPTSEPVDVKTAKKMKKRPKNHQESGDAQPTTNSTTNTGPEPEEQSNEQQQARKGPRFICFIGNLPFTATKESIAAHFKSVSPAFIRAPTKKESKTGESKGFAFLEFDRYDRMKSCLQLYHHSHFDDGKSPPRRLNVELT